MENKTAKLSLKLLVLIIIVFGVSFGGWSIYKGDKPDPQQKMQLGIIAYNKEANKCKCNPTKTVEEFEKEENDRVVTDIINATDNSVSYSVILTWVAVIIGLVFNIVGIIKNPKGLLKRVIMLAAFSILLLIVYFATNSNEVPIEIASRLETNHVPYDVEGYNLASWGIITAILLTIMTVLTVIIGGVYSLVKK